MTRDALLLLRTGWRVRSRVLRRVAPERLAVVGVVALACCWAVRSATRSVLTVLPAAQVAASLRLVTAVAALLLTASLFSASLALRLELAPFAHRISTRGLLLSRCLSAVVVAALVTSGLVALLAVGSRLTGAAAVQLGTRSLPAGVLAGLGLAVGIEALARAAVRSRAILLASRLVTSAGGLALAGLLVARPAWTPGTAAAGALVVVATICCGGFAALRPQWLAGRRATRLSVAATGPVAAHRVWHPLCLLWRDPLALPATSGLVVVIGLAAVVGRYPALAGLGQLYTAVWPLLVVVPTASICLVVVAKATPSGGGLFGHVVGPAALARSVVLVAVTAGVGVVLVGAVVASIAGGSWMGPDALLRFAAITVVAVALALAAAGVRPVRAAVVDMPASVSLGYLAAASVVVGALGSTRWPWIAASVAAGVPAALVLVSSTARRRAPFTR